ncbi:MAG: tetratricopeptide repeat protein [Flavobacteriaceae bacterium]
MKTKILILAALSFTMIGFAQKNEIKAAEKALKTGSSEKAKTTLEGVAGMISGADDKLKAHYYFVRGRAYADLAKKGDFSAFEEAVSSFRDVMEVEEKSGKSKYSGDAKQQLTALSGDLVNSAIKDNGEQKFKEAAEKLYTSYKISPKDTSYLYYAASSAVNGGEYEQALMYYNELQEVGYDGSGITYKATNIESGEVEEMDKTQRDLMVKSSSYKDPVDEKIPSKKGEIVKNIALIYTQLGQDEKAVEAYKAARENDPKDVNLILNQANLYYKMGDKEKFKSLQAEAAALAPDNPDLHYNMGVINMEQGNIKEARVAFNKALEINPGYTNAQLNLSTTYVNEGNGLIDEMNSLGNSRADIARYDELKAQKDSLFLDGSKILEESLKLNPDNQGILEQLKNIYGAMGDEENFLRIKKLLGE